MQNLLNSDDQTDEISLFPFINDSDNNVILEENTQNSYEKEIFNENYFTNPDKKTREMTNLKKKRGRKKEKENGKEEHTNLFLDNQIAKILVHYHKFLINLSNAYLEANNIHNHKFFPISGIFTKKRDLITLKKLLESSLRDFLKEEVSKKNNNLLHNKELIEHFDSNNYQNEFKTFFDMKYKFIYSEIFLINNKEKLLKDFGIKKNIEMYEDFILKIQWKFDQNYIEKMKETCKQFVSHIEFTSPKIQKKKRKIKSKIIN